MMMLNNSRLDPAEEEDRDYLSIARPVAVGIVTFLSLELVVVCLLFTQAGQRLIPGHPSRSLPLNSHRTALRDAHPLQPLQRT